MKKLMISNAEMIEKINKVARKIGRNVNIMEVCGTHTQAISHFGIRELLPKNVRLISGPGCPVCVTAQEDIDNVVQLAKSGIPIATYGDVMRVPGYLGSLDEARADGAQIFSVYSVEEALDLQKKYSNLVFFGMGFDTTAPLTAVALEQGLVVYSTHKLFLPAMEALLRLGEINIDGFLDPGHVSAIVGFEPYKKMKVAQVITGFEADDILLGIYMLLRQIADGRKDVENEYVRAVKKGGNVVAQKYLAKYFKIGDGNWRGFGIIPESGLEVKNSKLDAKIIYAEVLKKVDHTQSRKPTGCKCGEVIRGLVGPKKCPMFGKVCTPEKPHGPCMVSPEGSCNVEFRYKS